MMRRILHTLLLAAALASPAAAQDKARMEDYQSQLQQLFEEVYNAPTDNQRYHANETAVQLFAEALAAEGAFQWAWDFGTRVSVLTSPDKQFRIITWPVVSDAGEYECFGFLQSYSPKSEDYVVYELNDKSQTIINRQESTLSPDNWYGAVYQKLITTTHDGKTYYTLLGWSGVDCLTQRQVIEPICFKGGSGTPQFGQNLFRKERNLRRVVLEYTSNARVNLGYDEQYIRSVERVRAKRKTRGPATTPRRGRSGGRNAATAARTAQAVQSRIVSNPTEKVTEKKYKMILFDEVTPQVAGMEGLYQFYIPSGAELAYIWGEGKWELREGAQGRVTDKRLNQDFDKPHPKQAPAYKFEEPAD